MRARRWRGGWPRARRKRALLAGVAEAFGLDEPPERIEVYDNCHIQGANAVGAMIVAGPDGFEKARIPQVQHQDRRTSRPATTTP